MRKHWKVRATVPLCNDCTVPAEGLCATWLLQRQRCEKRSVFGWQPCSRGRRLSWQTTSGPCTSLGALSLLTRAVASLPCHCFGCCGRARRPGTAKARLTRWRDALSLRPPVAGLWQPTDCAASGSMHFQPLRERVSRWVLGPTCLLARRRCRAHGGTPHLCCLAEGLASWAALGQRRPCRTNRSPRLTAARPSANGRLISGARASPSAVAVVCPPFVTGSLSPPG